MSIIIIWNILLVELVCPIGVLPNMSTLEDSLCRFVWFTEQSELELVQAGVANDWPVIEESLCLTIYM